MQASKIDLSDSITTVIRGLVGKNTLCHSIGPPGNEVPMLDQKEISECVETLCDRGCESVREVIGKLESGQDVPETTQLDAGQRAAVLHELQRIMAVYDAKL